MNDGSVKLLKYSCLGKKTKLNTQTDYFRAPAQQLRLMAANKELLIGVMYYCSSKVLNEIYLFALLCVCIVWGQERMLFSLDGVNIYPQESYPLFK